MLQTGERILRLEQDFCTRYLILSPSVDVSQEEKNWRIFCQNWNRETNRWIESDAQYELADQYQQPRPTFCDWLLQHGSRVASDEIIDICID